MADKYLSADIYDIADYVDEIKKKYIEDETEETLMMGIYGYMSSIFSNELQNAIRIASQYCNEAIPTKAKFEKNIMTHALSMGMSNINAVPARMVVLMCFPEKELSTKMGNNGVADQFLFTHKTPIIIEGYEYHTDYDILITRKAGRPDKYVTNDNTVTYTYSARYIIDKVNTLSDITNPYLASVSRINLSGSQTMVAIPLVQIRQVELYDVTRKILTTNPIENKIITFTFDNQLADFYVEVNETGTDDPIYLTPVYEGTYTSTTELYCNYTYIDEKTIRVKFNRDSYEPTLNADVTIHSYLTEGASANFNYDTDVAVRLESDEYDYSGLYIVISPQTGSEFGSDKKSIDTIKKAIAKEALARGSITNTTDLENFFNSLSDEDSRLYFYKKRHNLREVIYYAFVLLRNSFGNIIPTNTINVELPLDMISPNGKILDKITVNPGKRRVYLNPGDTYAHFANTIPGVIDEIVETDDDGNISVTQVNEDAFVYISPFLCDINIDENYVSYYLTTMDTTKELNFDYINSNTTLQFVATTIQWVREFTEKGDIEEYDPDRINDDTGNIFKYSLNIELVQNIGTDFGVVKINRDKDNSIMNYSTDYSDSEGSTEWTNISDVNSITAIAVFYATDDTGFTSPLRYSVGELTDYDEAEFCYNFRFDFYTDDQVTENNRISIVNRTVKTDDSSIKQKMTNLLIPNDQHFNFSTMSIDDSELASEEAFEPNVNVRIFIMLKEPPVSYEDINMPEDAEILDDILNITGGKNSTLNDKYALTNVYSIVDGLEFYHNFTNIMESEIAIVEDTESSDVATIDTRFIRNMPLISYQYIFRGTDDDTVESMMKEFIEALETKRSYIEYCLEILEDALDIDFKFFNTYGPSNRYYISYDNTESIPINRVDITLKFKLKLINNSYANIVDNIKDYIKSYVEDIEEVGDIHIPNIITYVTTEYQEYITYFEFISFNYDDVVSTETVLEYDTDSNGNHIFIVDSNGNSTGICKTHEVKKNIYGTDYYGPGRQHIEDIGDDGKLDHTPEFINIRNNEYNSPDIVIELV
jgi:hypothetical protein